MSSSPDDAAKSVQKLSPLDGDAPESTDFANYFCTYAYLYHQKDMLEDHKRTSAYFRACVNNKKCFEGRVVLDVGTGSGILAIFAAKAGAKKVYAVEATDMARFARMLVDQNGFSDVIEVIQGTIETVQIPEKVDIIISEWMGYFLLRESMLDSVLVARDRFLKPDGALYPSHARLFVAPIWTHNGQNHRLRDYDNAMAGWGEFVEDMHSEYGVDMKVLSASFQKEQRDYFLCTAQWTDVHPDQLMGPPQVVKEFDLKAVTLDEIKAALDLRCALTFDVRGQVDALCGWFDVTFQGSAEHPAYQTVILNTGPDATGATHWGQQSFYFGKDVFLVNPGDKMDCSVTVERRKDNQRLLQISMAGKLSGSQVLERSFKWNIE